MIKKIYYINLDKRPDRNIHTLNEIKKVGGINVERINAIDGTQLDISNLSNDLISVEGKADALDKTKGLYYILTRGAIGCALSHLATYNKVIDELLDDEYALILEDDIYIDDNISSKLKYYFNKIPKFDILFIGYHNHIESIEYDEYGIPGKIWGLFGYIINKKAAIEIKKVFPLTHQIDTEMPKIFKNLNVFYLNEKLIKSDVSQYTNSKFPTDTQIRETFNNVNDNEFNDYILIIFLFLLILIIYLSCYKKNI